MAVLAWQRFGRTRSTPSLAAEPFQQVTDGPGAETFPTLSPDGKTVAYVVTLPEGEAIFTKRVGGTGLGLAVADYWTTRHGGVLYLESEVGKGTRVRVTLPLRRTEEPVRPRGEEAR